MFAKNHNTDPTEENWDREWKKYNNKPYFKPNNRILQVISNCFGDNVKGKKILELGAGSGSDIICLVQNGARGFAMDFSSESIQTINYWAKMKKVKVSTVKSGIENIPFSNNAFDMVYSVGLMEHFSNILPYLKEQIRIIKPGGFLLFYVPQTFTLYTIAKHIRIRFGTHPFGWETQYSKRDLIQLAKKLDQDVFSIFGGELDIISKLPRFLQSTCNRLYSKYIEDSPLGPYMSLGIGLVIKIKK